MSFIKNFNFNQNNTNFSENKINLDQIKIINNQNFTNVYLIVLDGMISLDKAEELQIIKSKENFYKKLSDNGYQYNDFFHSNYPVTYASIQSLLYGHYPITENSARYKNRLKFYPYNMNEKENFFYNIIHRLDMNFFWIGNKWGLCKGLKSGECFYNYSSNKNFLSDLIFSTELFYMNSIFSYFFNFLNRDIVITAFDFLRYKKFHEKRPSLKNKSDFFLLHVYKPHKPYNLDENCNDTPPKKFTSNEKKFYKINYRCALNVVLDWDKSFIDKKQNNIVIILGDHGWSFDQKDKNDINFAASRLNDVFFAYKIPKICESIQVPNSHVNVMRFVLNCINDLNLEYLTDTKYVIRYEGHKDYGKAFKLQSK